MIHPLDWNIDYCLSKIEESLTKTERIEDRLVTPMLYLEIDEQWRLRESLREIRSQVSILRDDMSKYSVDPPKTSFIKKLIRK